MTAIYTFRLIFIAFFGESHAHEVHAPHGLDHTLPLAVLAVFAVLGGLIPLPLESVLPEPHLASEDGKHLLEFISVAVSASGVAVAWFFFHKNRALAEKLARGNVVSDTLRRLWSSAWGFDWLYEQLFQKPYLWFIRVNGHDFVESFVAAVPVAFQRLHAAAALSQNGRTRWYAVSMAAGAILMITMVLL